MKPYLIWLSLIVFIFSSAAVLITYDLSWNNVSGGSQHTSAGSYSLDSSIGQSVAGVISHGTSEICTGFLCGDLFRANIYLPMVSK